MLASQLIEAARTQRLNDVVAPFLWTDEQLLAWLSEAQREAVIRCDACVLPEQHSLTVVGGATSVPLPANIKRITGVWRNKTRLTPKSAQVIAGLREQGWVGDPQFYHATHQAMSFDRIAGVSVALQVDAEMLPALLATANHNLQIPEHLQPALLSWIEYRAFGLRDAETGDANKSMQALAEFERAFGGPVTAGAQTTRVTPRKRTVKANW